MAAEVVVVFEHKEPHQIQYRTQFFFCVKLTIGLLLLAADYLLPQRAGEILKGSDDLPLALVSEKLAVDGLYFALEGLLSEFDVLEVVHLPYYVTLFLVAPDLGHGGLLVDVLELEGQELGADWHCLAHF